VRIASPPTWRIATRAGYCSGAAHATDLEQHLPLVVVLDDARLLGGHDNLLVADRVIDLVEERRVKVLAAVDATEIAPEARSRHRLLVLLGLQ